MKRWSLCWLGGRRHSFAGYKTESANWLRATKQCTAWRSFELNFCWMASFSSKRYGTDNFMELSIRYLLIEQQNIKKVAAGWREITRELEVSGKKIITTYPVLVVLCVISSREKSKYHNIRHVFSVQKVQMLEGRKSSSFTWLVASAVWSPAHSWYVRGFFTWCKWWSAYLMGSAWAMLWSDARLLLC